MKKKIYQFRLPEVQYLATHHAAFGDTWMEGQKLPVYALIAESHHSTLNRNYLLFRRNHFQIEKCQKLFIIFDRVVLIVVKPFRFSFKVVKVTLDEKN